MFRETICSIAQIAIPVWIVLSVLIVVKLIGENNELQSKVMDMITTLEKATSNCDDILKTSRELIDQDRNELSIFESKTAEIEELRSKYEFRVQEVSEYLDSFADRLDKAVQKVVNNDEKVHMLDRDVESCSKAVCLLINDVREMKERDTKLWFRGTPLTFNPPAKKPENGEK